MKSYKEKCLYLLEKASIKYQSLLGKDFMIESEQFKYRRMYILRFYEGNFLHLTGVKTKLKPEKFFYMCLNKKLNINDFDCDSTKEIKGYTSEKIPHLLGIDKFFTLKLDIQEKLSRGRVVCLFAASEGTFTLGFTGGKGSLNPMTLLNRNNIHPSQVIKDYKITVIKRPVKNKSK